MTKIRYHLLIVVFLTLVLTNFPSNRYALEVKEAGTSVESASGANHGATGKDPNVGGPSRGQTSSAVTATSSGIWDASFQVFAQTPRGPINITTDSGFNTCNCTSQGNG